MEDAGMLMDKDVRESPILIRMDQDIDRIFTLIDSLRSGLDPILTESVPSAEVAMASDPPRNKLEGLALRLPVIAGQLNDLVKRVAL